MADCSASPNHLAAIRLTPREAEVLSLVTQGKSNKEVASELFCSKRTVDFHLARIYEKLNVRNRLQAVMVATVRLQDSAHISTAR